MVIVTQINTLSTHYDAATLFTRFYFLIGSTIHINGDITASATTTDTVVKIEAYLNLSTSDVLKATPLDTTHSFSNNTSQSIKTDINSGTAPTIDTTGYDAGDYYLKLTLSGSGVETTYLYVGFTIYAAVPVPLLSNVAITDSSINQDESATVTFDATNMTSNDNAVLILNDKAYKATTTDNAAYTFTFYGHNLVSLTSETIEVLVENRHGRDSDTSLSITVTNNLIEPVLHIYNLLNDNWDTNNVAKPQMMKGGDVGGDKYLSNGDVIKLYRSPSTAIRKNRFLGMTHEDTEDFVLLDINTMTDRNQLRLLEIESKRILNDKRKEPGGGYSWMWSDRLDTRSEFADHFRQVYEVQLKRISKTVST